MQHLHTQQFLKILRLIAQNNGVLFFFTKNARQEINPLFACLDFCNSVGVLQTTYKAGSKEPLPRYPEALSKGSRRSGNTHPSGQPAPQVPSTHGRTPAWRAPARGRHLPRSRPRGDTRSSPAGRCSATAPRSTESPGRSPGRSAAAPARAASGTAAGGTGGTGGGGAARPGGGALPGAAGRVPGEGSRTPAAPSPATRRCWRRLPAGDRCGRRAGPDGAAPQPPPCQPPRAPTSCGAAAASSPVRSPLRFPAGNTGPGSALSARRGWGHPSSQRRAQRKVLRRSSDAVLDSPGL